MGQMQTFFTALADRTRRRILNLMRDRELCVYDFVDALNISQPKISRHLAFLRGAGIVSTRREGKWIFYKMNEPEDHFRKHLLETTLEWINRDSQMQDDYARLINLFSQPNDSVILDKAVNTLPETNMYSIILRRLKLFYFNLSFLYGQ